MLALVIGSADGFEHEVKEALSTWKFDLVLVTNRVVADIPIKVDVAVTLHPRLMVKWWAEREERGFPQIPRCVSHKNKQGGQNFGFVTDVLDYMWPNQLVSGSSGHFAVKAALDLFGADKVVLAGVPMSQDRKHYYSEDDWYDARVFLPAWVNTASRLRNRVKSMSGWTMDLLGGPTDSWVYDTDQQQGED